MPKFNYLGFKCSNLVIIKISATKMRTLMTNGFNTVQ